MIDHAKYGEWVINHNPKPIPTTDHDWDFAHPNWDGTNGLAGTGKSIADCIEQIKEIER